jgi:hypothetical protein
MHVHPFSRAWRYANRFLTTKWLRSLHLKFTGGCFFHIHSVSVRAKYIIVVAFCHGFDPPVMFYSVNPWSWHYIISKVSTSKTMWCVGGGFRLCRQNGLTRQHIPFARVPPWHILTWCHPTNHDSRFVFLIQLVAPFAILRENYFKCPGCSFGQAGAPAMTSAY